MLELRTIITSAPVRYALVLDIIPSHTGSRFGNLNNSRATVQSKGADDTKTFVNVTLIGQIQWSLERDSVTPS